MTRVGSGSRRLAAAAALVFFCIPGRDGRSQVMSGPGMEIGKLDSDLAGGPGFGAGSLSLSYALCQQAGVGFMESGGLSIGGGFYGSGGAGGPSAAGGRGAPATGTEECPDPALRRMTGVFIGVPVSQAMCVSFDRMMLPSTFASALSVVRARDSSGAAIHSPVEVSTRYDLASGLLVVSASGTWASNSEYSLAVGTEARDQEGVPLAEPATFQFLTLADPSAANAFVALEDTSTRLLLAAGALPGEGHVEINARVEQAPQTVSPAVIAAANAKLERNLGPFARVASLREINYYDAQRRAAKMSFARGAATLSLPCADSDGDGIIDGTNPPARTRTAALYYLDEERALWVRLPGSSASGGVVSGNIPHLSVFAVAAAQDMEISRAYAFPSPFRPHGPNAGLGAGQTGSDGAGITFADLPVPAEVEVFNVLGESVWRGTENAGSGRLVWDTRGHDGSPAASGVYFFAVRNSAGESRVQKLAIIR